MIRWQRGKLLGPLALLFATTLALTISACSGGDDDTSGDPSDAHTLNKKFSGQTIRLLIPSWTDMGKEKYAQFTKKTGIKVKTDVQQFDKVHDKSVTAMQSGTAPADVIEVDWRWLPQYSAAGWLEPIKPYVNPKFIKSAEGTDIFKYKNKQYAMPYALDFRWIKANMTLLKKAGVSKAPSTWDDLYKAAKKLKAKGIVKYPLGMPLSVEDETLEPWFSLIRMNGGKLLDDDGHPIFQKSGSDGLSALKFLRKAAKAKLINPGYTNESGEDVARDFGAGKTAFDMRNGPQITYNDKKKDKVAGDTFQNLVLGKSKAGKQVFGEPEAMGIPAKSEHKEAAAMFINWYQKTDNQVFMFDHQSPGDFPTQPAAIDQLTEHNKVPQGEAVEHWTKHIVPLFEDGTPTWFAKFSNDGSSVMQNVLLGKTAASTGLSKLAHKVKSY